MRPFLILAFHPSLLVHPVCTALAQSLTVFDLDTTQLPVMKAKFYANIQKK